MSESFFSCTIDKDSKILGIYPNIMTSPKWNIARRVSKEHQAKFSEYDHFLVQILFNRHLKTQDQIDEFFNPDFNQDLHDPFLYQDMERAVERLVLAVSKKERVAIYGDYDADGVTASVILTDLLKALGLSGQIYIPNRQTEGYGLNKKAIDWLKRKKIDLIVTCDCGVSNREEIDYAAKKNMDVLVFDHHHLAEEFSDDYIVIDAKRKSDKYPFKELCAAGVIFKLAEAFFRHRPKELKVKNKEAFLKWLLDLVAIGTVADCVPLLGENRTLVKYGLKVFSKTKRPGLKALAASAKLDRNEVLSYHLGYFVGPRINAAGRMDHANTGYKLLVSREKTEALELAVKLERTNERRQNLTEKIFKEAMAKIKRSPSHKKILIVKGVNWPIGILGIVAGKIEEEFSRPAIVFSEDKNLVGSGRGPSKFDLIEAIVSCRSLLVEYGGHKQAAGLTLEKKNFTAFKQKMEEIAEKKLKKADLVPQLRVDLLLKPDEINWNLWKNISSLEPFGEGNPEPVFLTKSLTVSTLSKVGKKGGHLKLILADARGKKFSAIGFRQGERIEEARPGEKIDVVFNLLVNEWQGSRNLELKILDFKKSD